MRLHLIEYYPQRRWTSSEMPQQYPYQPELTAACAALLPGRRAASIGCQSEVKPEVPEDSATARLQMSFLNITFCPSKKNPERKSTLPSFSKQSNCLPNQGHFDVNLLPHRRPLQPVIHGPAYPFIGHAFGNDEVEVFLIKQMQGRIQSGGSFIEIAGG
jgi:hypothetical protein